MERIDLSGDWELSRTAGDTPLSLPDTVTMQVPGDNITALLRADAIPNPFFGRNELDLQWIGRCNWRIKRSFTVSSGASKARALYFTADSLDTIAEVAVNGTRIVSSANMFQRVRVELQPGLLRTGNNVIEIDFFSPELAAAKHAAALPYPVPHQEYDVQSPHRNLIRKVQCHSGWDWGPSLMVSGVCGDIRIEAGDAGLFEYLPTRVHQNNTLWTLEVSPVLRLSTAAVTSPDRSLPLVARLITPDGAVAQTVETEVVVPAPECAHPEPATVIDAGPVVFSVTEPQLWWPAGEGKQPLYTVEVEMPGDTARTRVGFRTVELRRSPDEDGTGFAFVVNGRPIFARGANWIPQSALPGLAGDEELVHLLRSAVQANMNMLRVWGGGTYESDRFYDLCDELGLLIWQDFMFSCSLYPSNQDFLDSVREEVRHQVLRLKNHASIALWCGNNEDLGALTWYDVSRENRDRYVVDYDRLNEGSIGSVVRHLDPDRPFWPSSPAAGPDDYSENWTADSSGDMHYWSVWHSGEPFASYRSVVPRFCSEFGFQSFPSRAVVKSFTTENGYNVTSPDMEHHQRSPGGNKIMMETMARYFRFPSTFDQQLYLSQVQQALAIATAVEFWRTRKPRCMGALYWQLNDTWPVASWASIEFGGAWKLLHYAARRFFDPLLVTAIPVDGEGAPVATEAEVPAAWSIYVVNDVDREVSGMVTIRVRTFGGATVRELTSAASAAPGESVLCATINRTELGAAVEDGFLSLRLEAAGYETRTASLFFTQPKRCNLRVPTITPSVASARNRTRVTLTTDAPSFYTSLSLDGVPGHFSDNFLLLLPEAPVTVDVETAAQPDQVRDALRIMNLADMGGPR